MTQERYPAALLVKTIRPGLLWVTIRIVGDALPHDSRLLGVWNNETEEFRADAWVPTEVVHHAEFYWRIASDAFWAADALLSGEEAYQSYLANIRESPHHPIARAVIVKRTRARDEGRGWFEDRGRLTGGPSAYLPMGFGKIIRSTLPLDDEQTIFVCSYSLKSPQTKELLLEARTAG